ncbi:MAG TPA: hypothetical protein VFR81_26645, partial [Longimicrobium sp.]|nr:hypothetical protein [Longimicrobium sp.]
MNPLPRAPRRLAVLAALCAAAGVHSAPGAGEWDGNDVPRGFVAVLARETDAAPAIAPRLSISSGSTGWGWRTAPAAAVPGASALAPGTGADPARLLHVAARAQA